MWRAVVLYKTSLLVLVVSDHLLLGYLLVLDEASDAR